jgi:hypothetical protein
VKQRGEEECDSLSARRQPGCAQALHLAVALREAAAAGAAGVRLQAFPGGDDLRHPAGILSDSDGKIQPNQRLSVNPHAEIQRAAARTLNIPYRPCPVVGF